MKVFKIGCYLFLYFAITACSNTAKIKLASQSNHYYAKDFSHHEFITHHKGLVKKVAFSDQQLLLSMLNRAMPEDQRMMLTFAKSQEYYLPENTIVGIQIKGDKQADETETRVISNYAHVIEQDINAVMISAMPK